MPQYTIPLQGGGTITVNASSQAAAINNVLGTGNTPASSGGGSSSSSGGGGGGGTSSSGGGGGTATYQTKNGTQTLATMEAQLRAVGWGGGEDVATAYARTTGAPVTPAGSTGGSSGSAGGGGGGGAVTGQVGFNADAARLAAEVANNAAQQEYLRAKLNLDSDELAFKKAQQTWQNTFDTAKFDYQKTIDSAGLLGTFNGQPTLAAQKQQAELTGVFNGQPTLARESEQNKTALGYLGLIGGLRGPQDYGQYLKVLASTPGGLRDLVNTAAGRYQGGSGTTGVQPVPVSLGGVVNDVATGGGQQYADFMQAGSGLPAPNQIAPKAYNAMTTTQRQLLGSLYEGQGWMPQDVTDLYKASLPKYAFGSTTGRLAVAA